MRRPRRRAAPRLAATILFLLAVPPPAIARAGGGERCEVDGRYVMGTVLQVELCAARRVRDDGFAVAFDAASRLEELLTTWTPTGAATRLNARAGEGLAATPPEVVELLSEAREYAVVTGGTFDVTVGPLVALWRDAAARDVLPSGSEIAGARARVGSERIVLATDGGAAALAERGMTVDFGGIGKGYALDRIAARLRAGGVASALLDFGRSSIHAIGTPPGAAGWRLLLRHPTGVDLGVVTLRDRAMSVSGSFGQVSEIAGRRFGHVLDPRTGWPLERDLVAAVVAPTGAAAEALSKALLLLGEHDGIALLERLEGVEGMLVEAGGARWSTSGWQVVTAFGPAPLAGS